MADDRIRVVVTGDSKDLQRASQEAKTSVRSLGNEVKRADGQVRSSTRTNERYSASLAGLGREIGGVNRNASFLRNNIALLRFPALIAGAGLAAQALSALGAGAAATASSLATLSGTLVALPAGLSALGQAAFVAKLGLGGVGEALAGNEAALKRLTPEQRRFVAGLKELKPLYDDLRATASRPLFAGIDRGIDDAIGNFGRLRTEVHRTGRVLGTLSERTGNFLGSADFGRDIRSMGRSNARVLDDLGSSSIHLARALTDVTIAGGPLVRWMSESAREGSKNIQVWAESARRSGDLAHFFGETRDTLELLAPTLGNTAAALLNIGKAAKPLGDDILTGLRDASAGWRRWTESVAGRNELRQYFDDARPAIWESGRLARDVTKAFFELGTQPGVANLLRKLRTDLLPVLVQVVATTTQAFGPHLIDALVSFTRLFGDLAGASGPLTLYVQLLGFAADALHALFQEAPVLRAMVVSFVGLAAVMKTIEIAGKLAGVSKLIGAYNGLQKAARAATVAELTGAKATTGQKMAKGILDGLGGLAGKVRTRLGRVRDVMTRVLSRGGESAGATAGGEAAGSLLSRFRTRMGRLATRIRDILRRVMARGGEAAGTTAAGEAAGNLAGGLPGQTEKRQKKINKTMGKVGKGAGVALVAGLVAAFWTEFFDKAWPKIRDEIEKRFGSLAADLASAFTPGGIGLVAGRRESVRDAARNAQGRAHGGPIGSPGAYGGGDRRHVLAEDGEHMLSKHDVRAAGGHGAVFALRRALHRPAQRMQAGGAVGSVDAGKIKIPIAEELTKERGKAKRPLDQITADFRELARDTEKKGKLTARGLTDGLKSGGRDAKRLSERTRRDVVGEFDAMSDDTEKRGRTLERRLQKVFDGVSDMAARRSRSARRVFVREVDGLGDSSEKRLGRLAKVAAARFGDMERHGTARSRGLSRSVARSMSVTDSAVHTGLSYVAVATREALKAFDAKAISLSVPRPKGIPGKATGGIANPAGGPQDDHLLYDPRGRPVAALSGTEGILNAPQMGVVNQALGLAKASGASAWGSLRELWGSGMRHYAEGGRLPGFARGGIVPIPGMPGESIHASILKDVVGMIRKYRMRVTDGYAPTGHAAGGEHPLGLAIDVVPGGGGSWGLIGKAMSDAGYPNPPNPPFRWLGWNNEAGHGSGHHGHFSWNRGQHGFSAAGDVDVPKIVVRGTDGSMKVIAQSSINAGRKGANAFIDEQAAASLGDAMGSFGAIAGGGSAGKNMQLGRKMLNNPGQWPFLRELWQRESGWNHHARNPSSGAYGIPQALPASKMGADANPPKSNPGAQIGWGLNYIKGRYGTPSRALAFHSAHNWYAEGGLLGSDGGSIADVAELFAKGGAVGGGFFTGPGFPKAVGANPAAGVFGPSVKAKLPKNAMDRYEALGKLLSEGEEDWGRLEGRFNLDDVIDDSEQAQLLGGKGALRDLVGEQIKAAQEAVDQITVGLRQRLNRRSELEAEINELLARVKKTRERFERLDKKKSKTKADKAELKRLRGSLDSDRDKLQQLGGDEARGWTRAKQFVDAPEESKYGKARKSATDFSEAATTWAENLDDAKDRFEDYNLEIDRLGGRRDTAPDSGTGADSQLAELLREQLRQSDANLRLSQAQYPIFGRFLSGLGLVGGLGGFARGAMQVPHTGLAYVHRDETILSDPQGPYGNQLRPYPNQGGGAAAAPVVHITVQADPTGALKVIDARIDQRAAKVTNRQLGRDSRTLTVAPSA